MYNQVIQYITPVYQVGGSVRDELMGLPPKDYDFATPLLPDQVEELIKGYGKRAYSVGKRFGTVGFKIDGQMVDVTTFRNERYQLNSRKPIVEFVHDITADLSRRDFTINAIAKQGERIIDPFGGRLDVLGKTIKCVGNAGDRFKEDPLRMLRMARFATQLEFGVDSNTFNNAKKLAHRITFVSRERWGIELDKILSTAHPSIALDLLMGSGLLAWMMPELSLQWQFDQHSPYHTKTLWSHTLTVVDAVPKEELTLRWAALLHDIAKPYIHQVKTNPDRWSYIGHDMLGAELVERMGLYLKWSTARRLEVQALVLNHMQEASPLSPYDIEGH